MNLNKGNERKIPRARVCIYLFFTRKKSCFQRLQKGRMFSCQNLIYWILIFTQVDYDGDGEEVDTREFKNKQ